MKISKKKKLALEDQMLRLVDDWSKVMSPKEVIGTLKYWVWFLELEQSVHSLS